MSGYVYLGVGGQLEVPVRSASLPINLWQRRSAIDVTHAQPSQDESQGEWKRRALPVQVDVAAGDTVLRASVTLSIAGAFRREQGFLDLGFPDTNDWGMAFDGADPLTTPFVGPGSLYLQAQLSTRGLAWPNSISVTSDLLILRAGLVADAPPPFSADAPSRRMLPRHIDRPTDESPGFPLTP